MNTDIRIDVGFLDHLKTVKLERRLGVDGVKSLVALWLWSAQNKPSGDLSDYSIEDIASYSSWKGKPEIFMEALVDLEWIDEESGKSKIHNWHKHQPHLKKFTYTKRPCSKTWSKIKKFVLERDSNRCIYCGASKEQMECDHVVPLSKGGDNSISNLASCCPDCNRRKGAKSPDEWLR